ncbi:MAG: ribulose-phosphate 3-epimerase [Flavobacteriia bacterium]|nr:ribulose-phosphate 3-epimerase [Flavobacteriia bacterium]
MKTKIAPSLLSCDFGNLNNEIAWLNDSSADYLHIDVMDGLFVPNISFGFPIIQCVKKRSTKPLDVHLMIQHPENYIKEFHELGTDILTFHYESVIHIHRTVQEIKKLGMKAGIAINPHTPINVLNDIITDIDMVLIMSVNPGFGGQSFIENTYQKVSDLKQLIEHKKCNTWIEVDGGVNEKNSSKLIQSGVDMLVAGSAIFNSNNPSEMIEKLRMV